MTVIKAFAHANLLTKDVTNDHYLTPEVRGTLYTEDIINRLAAKEIATKNVNGASFVSLFLNECILALLEGYNVVTDLFQASLGIQGTVYDYDLGHPISADRLNILINLVQGAKAREAVRTLTVEVHKEASSGSPVLQSVMNPTKQVANTLNTGSMVLIQGLNIALRGEDSAVGIKFSRIGNAPGEDRPEIESEPVNEIVIPSSDVYPNTSTKLQFTLPADITTGQWKVSIATQSGSSNKHLTKDVRIHEYPHIITIV